MKLYLIEYSTPFKNHSDYENNEVREVAARNDFQVGDFDSERSVIELEGNVIIGNTYFYRDSYITIIDLV